MKALSSTVSGSPISFNLYPATVTPNLPARQITVGQFPANNPNWSRQVQISDQFIFVKRGTYAVAISLADVINLALTQEVNLTWTPPVILTQPSNETCAETAAATGTLTNNGTNVSDAVAAAGTLTGSGSANVTDGDTVTLGTQVYRFKNTMAAINDVQIGGSGNTDTSLLSLIRAINGSGTPGTDYFTGTTANASVTAATSVTSHAFAVTAKTTGTAGNAIASTETSSNLSFGGTTLSGGAAADTVTISGKAYTFQNTLTNVDGNVKIGASNTASMTNLFHAINASGGTPGTDYAAAMTANASVTATNPTGTTVVVTAKTTGTAGNAITTTETSGELSWGGATLSGGTASAAVFTFTAGSEYTITYLWQYSTDGGTTWATATGTINGTAYTGGTTNTLTCTPTTPGQTGLLHRCVVTDNAGSFGLTNGSINCNSVVLTIP